MITSIISLGLEIALKIVAAFFQKTAEREKYERLVRDAIGQWEKRVENATKLRKAHRKVDDDLEEEYRKRWGNPVDPSEFAISCPSTVQSGEIFIARLSNAPKTALIMRDNRYEMAKVRGRTVVELVSYAKNEVISIGLVDNGKILAATLVKVEA